MGKLSKIFHPIQYKDQCYLFNPEFTTLMNVDPIVHEIVSLSDEELKAIDQYSEDYQVAYTELSEYAQQIDQHAVTIVEIVCPQPVKALDLHIAHICNLRCSYCYGEGGHYGGNAEIMEKETALKAVDFLLKNSADEEQLNITFFGGEPMMNFDVVKEVVSYSKMMGEKYGNTITNGLRSFSEALMCPISVQPLTRSLWNFCSNHSEQISISTAHRESMPFPGF